MNNYRPDAHYKSCNPQANDGVTFNALDTLKETGSVDDESLTICILLPKGNSAAEDKVLSNDRTMSIRNKKTIGTRKHNSEATKSAQHAKDSDGPSDEHPTKNTQGTSPSMSAIDDTLSNQSDGRAEWYDNVAQKVEPRSYRSVLLNE